ncbi:MAG: DUF4192 family protein [Tetrasphaera sp.]
MPIPVRNDADLLTAVPYLLGFRPRSSLVIVSLRAGLVSHLTRLDLPLSDDFRRSWLATALGLAVRHTPDAVCLIGFDAAERCGPLLRGLASRLRLRALPVAALLVVDAESWRHLEPGPCAVCPGAGHPPPENQALAVAAEFVIRGFSPFASRSALADSLAPDQDYLNRLTATTPDATSGRGHSAASVGRAEGAWRALLDLDDRWDPEPEHLLVLAVSLADADWRDALIAQLVPGLVPVQELAAHHVRRAEQIVRYAAGSRLRTPRAWGDGTPARAEFHRALADRVCLLARRTPGRLAAGPYAMLAVLTGCWGDGATAALAAEYALRADPDHVLATLVLRLYARGRSLASPDRLISRTVG